MTTLAYKIYEIMSDKTPRCAKDIKNILGARYKLIKNCFDQSGERGNFERVGLRGKSMLFRITPKGLDLYEQRKKHYTKPCFNDLDNVWR